jgi:hypothetical protein
MTDLPTRTPRQLLISTSIALAIAALILFVIVLPAEYAADPTGAGRALGLLRLGEAKRVAANQSTGEVMHSHPRKPFNGNVTVQMSGREELEYKATLAQGEPMFYAWRVQGGPVYFEFHGEPTEGDWPKDYFRSYEIKASSVAEQGSFVAPFTGRHGWFWRNLSDEPAVITLEAVGYYSKLGRIENSAAQVE